MEGGRGGGRVGGSKLAVTWHICDKDGCLEHNV